MPASEKLDSATVDAYKVADTGADLDDLMSQLRGTRLGSMTGGKRSERSDEANAARDGIDRPRARA